MHSFTGRTILSIVLLLFATQCGGSSSTSTTTTTSTSSLDTSELATRVESVSSALVPSIKSSYVTSSLSDMNFAITYQEEADWSVLTGETYSYLVTDIFGDPEESPQVVTKVRVLLDQFQTDVASLFSSDADIDCTGVDTLDEEDTLSLPFLGSISNGTSNNRFFDCHTSSSGETSIYGQDEDGVIRIAQMSESLTDNEESTETRGNSVQFYSIIYSTYAESTASDTTTGYLDLQYAQATIYSGLDDEIGTDDDVIFKSRTRIVGQATLDSNGTITSATGDFIVTKFDQGVNDDDSTYTITTQNIGRGGYQDSDTSLFSITTDTTTASDSDGIFCLQHSSSSLPTVSDSVECEDYESAFAWGSIEFPFTVTPSLTETFEDIDPFAGNNTDLIAADGSNFTIPTYTTVTTE